MHILEIIATVIVIGSVVIAAAVVLLLWALNSKDSWQ